MDGHFPLTFRSAVRLWLMVAGIAVPGSSQDAPPAPGPGPAPSEAAAPPDPAPGPPPPVDGTARAADEAAGKMFDRTNSNAVSQPVDTPLEADLERVLKGAEQNLVSMNVGFELPSPSTSAGERIKRVEECLASVLPGHFAEETQRMKIGPDSSPEKRISRVSWILIHKSVEDIRVREAWIKRAWIAGGVLSICGIFWIGIMIGKRNRRLREAAAGPSPPSASVSGENPSPGSVSAYSSSPEAKAAAMTRTPTIEASMPGAAPAKKGRKLFISFSTSNLEFVENVLAPALREAGHLPWFSTVSIRPSDLWERSILSGLEECEWVLTVMSPHAVSSKWVQLETHWATEHREGRIVPLMIARCNPWKLHMKLGNVQYVDFEHSSEAMTDLLDIIETKSRTPEASQ